MREKDRPGTSQKKRPGPSAKATCHDDAGPPWLPISWKGHRVGGRALLRRVVQIPEMKKVESGCFLETVFFLYSQTKKLPPAVFRCCHVTVTTQHFFWEPFSHWGGIYEGSTNTRRSSLELDPGIAPPSAFPQAWTNTWTMDQAMNILEKKISGLKRKTRPKKLT